jgi:small subunit ribosomal protein S5
VAKRQRDNKREDQNPGVIERTVKIKRCAAVVKGGRRFSFAAMVVCGDGKGKVGSGYGKANEVQPSVEKANKQAVQAMKLSKVNLVDGTISHRVDGRFGAARVVLLPAGPGTGIIAGSAVRAVCEAAGVKNILTKSFGSNNPVTLVKATIAALTEVRTKEDIERLRGVEL